MSHKQSHEDTVIRTKSAWNLQNWITADIRRLTGIIIFSHRSKTSLKFLHRQMCDVRCVVVLGAKTEHFILKHKEFIIFGLRVNELDNFGSLYLNWKSGQRSRLSHNYHNWITEGWNYSDRSNECVASFASYANRSWELRIKWMWGLILLQYCRQLSHAGSLFLFRNMIYIF